MLRRRLSLVVICLGCVMPVAGVKTTFAQVVANSIADFSGTQNTNNWQYGRWVPTGPTNSSPGTFTQLGHFTGTTWVVSTTQTNPNLTSTTGHPGFSGACGRLGSATLYE